MGTIEHLMEQHYSNLTNHFKIKSYNFKYGELYIIWHQRGTNKKKKRLKTIKPINKRVKKLPGNDPLAN